MSEQDQDQQIVAKAVDQLGEHFDSVQVFVTRYEPNGGDQTSTQLNCGSGNWLTRYGHIKDWLLRQEAIAAEEARRSV